MRNSLIYVAQQIYWTLYLGLFSVDIESSVLFHVEDK